MNAPFYSQPIEKPTNMTEGLANFVQMAINELEAGNTEKALLIMVDLKNDIGSTYHCRD